MFPEGVGQQQFVYKARDAQPEARHAVRLVVPQARRIPESTRIASAMRARRCKKRPMRKKERGLGRGAATRARADARIYRLRLQLSATQQQISMFFFVLFS